MGKIFNSREVAEEYAAKATPGDNQETEVEETEATTEETETEENAEETEGTSDEETNDSTTDDSSDDSEEESEEESELLESVDFKNIRKIGNELVWIVDPEDEKSTVYKGKDFAGLLENVQKGLQAKDSYINELKSKGEMKSESSEEEAKEEEAKEGEKKTKKKPVKLDVDIEEEAFPDPQAIMQETLKRYGLPEDVINWGKEQWREFEDENTASEAMVLRQKIDKAQDEARKQYDSHTARVLNNTQLKEESDAVANLLDQFDIDPQNFDFKAVLDEVHSNKDNFYENGIRRSGAIVSTSMKAIREYLQDSLTNKASSEVSLKFRKSLDKVKQASKGTPKGQTPPAKKQKKKAYQTTKDVIRDWKRAMAEGKTEF